LRLQVNPKIMRTTNKISSMAMQMYMKQAWDFSRICGARSQRRVRD